MYSKHLSALKERHAILSTPLLCKTELQQAHNVLAPIAYLNHLLEEN